MLWPNDVGRLDFGLGRLVFENTARMRAVFLVFYSFTSVVMFRMTPGTYQF